MFKAAKIKKHYYLECTRALAVGYPNNSKRGTNLNAAETRSSVSAKFILHNYRPNLVSVEEADTNFESNENVFRVQSIAIF